MLLSGCKDPDHDMKARAGAALHMHASLLRSRRPCRERPTYARTPTRVSHASDACGAHAAFGTAVPCASVGAPLARPVWL